MTSPQPFKPTLVNIRDCLALFEIAKDAEALEQWIDGLIALSPAPSQAAQLAVQVTYLRIFGAVIQGAFTPTKEIES